ncbi:MAG: DUF1127 domain-containing protein [Hyphomicrobiaceae bacterium]
MSTTTATFGHHSAAAAAPRKSFFQRMIDARLRQGAAHARAALARMSDTQLADLGLTPEQVRDVRKTGSVPTSFWA